MLRNISWRLNFRGRPRLNRNFLMQAIRNKQRVSCNLCHISLAYYSERMLYQHGRNTKTLVYLCNPVQCTVNLYILRMPD